MFSFITICLALLVLAAGVLALLALFRKRSEKSMSQHTLDDTDNRTSRGIQLDSLTARAGLIAFLALLMLLPLALVDNIVVERGYRYQSVLEEIAGTWGSEQVLMAPVLIVPFTEVFSTQETITDDDGNSRIIDKTVRHNRTAQFLPGALEIDVSMQDEFRRRGIFRSLVYSADISVRASFGSVDPSALSDNIEEIHWQKAWVSIGLSDTRAINGVSSFLWDSDKKVLSPGTRSPFLRSGFHAELPELQGNTPNILTLDMSVNGSGAFSFAPLGETTSVSMQSTWPHPSFKGDALPEERTITEAGFSAVWKIPHLARNYPQRWSSAIGDIDLYEFTAGTSMFEPVSLYSQVTRAVKYGLLFVGLTFLTLLIFEIAIKKQMHIVQYGLIGTALCLFYLLLLSLSEHIAFVQAYTISALVTITMISCYAGVVLKSAVRAVTVLTLLTGLYAILYALLQLEDYALLAGTALLLVIVMVLMYVTRNTMTELRPR